MNRKSILFSICTVAMLCVQLPLFGAQILTNGGFDSGLSGWTRVDQAGSDGTFALQSGTLSPVNGVPVPAPPGLPNAAMTDAQGPGTHVLYQDFTVTAPVGSAVLSFTSFLGNGAGAFYTPTPASLDFAVAAFNQQARVDLMFASAPVFSVAGSDILFNILQTGTSTPINGSYAPTAVNLASALNANLNTTLRLRFAEVDNVAPFQFGVDSVGLETSPVPEPSALATVSFGLLIVAAGLRWRKARSVTSL